MKKKQKTSYTKLIIVDLRIYDINIYIYTEFDKTIVIRYHIYISRVRLQN